MKRILFVTSTRIGDAVLSTGLIWRLAEQHPDCRITVACGPLSAPLFAALPNVTRVIEINKRRYSLHWLELWSKCIFTWWYLVVDLRGSGLAWCLPTWLRRIFRGNRRDSFLRRLIRGTHRDTHRHRVEEISDVLNLKEPCEPRLKAPMEAQSRAAALIPTSASNGEIVLAIAPVATWPGKQWRIENFVGLVRLLTGEGGLFEGARVAVLGAANERDQALAVIEAVPEGQCIDLVGTVDLPTLFACLEQCSFYIGNDSGLTHMAAAAGIPTLGLFGPTDERHYAPWGENAAVVRTALSLKELVGFPEFDWNRTGTLMDSLTIDAVIISAENLWNRCRSGDGAPSSGA